MSCIFYKFKNNRDYDSLTFDGLYISLLDLKKMIMQVKKLKPTEVDLQIENAQTKTAYKTNSEMIPKNTSVIVSRIPVAKAQPRDTRAQWDRYKQEQKELEAQREADSQERLNQTADLINAKASEADKIKAMIQQSTRDFNPENYVKTNKYPSGPVPSTYVCFKCQQPGHFIQNCPNKPVDSGVTEVRMKRPTGIPNCFLSPATAGDPGALLTYSGHFAVPIIDAAAYKKGKKERPPFLPAPPEEEKPMIRHPKEMICQLCEDLLREAVLIPCCGTSFCDECIRNSLLETEEHECPTCHETEISPDRLTANLSMRSLVLNYLTKLSEPERKVDIPHHNAPVPNVVPLRQHQSPPRPDPEPASDFPPDFMYLPPQVKAVMLRERERKKIQATPQPPPQNVNTLVPPPTHILERPTGNQVPPPLGPPSQQRPPTQNQSPVVDSQKLPNKESDKDTGQKSVVLPVPQAENVEAPSHITVRSNKQHKPITRVDGFRDIPPGISPPLRPPMYAGPPGPPPGHMYHPAPRMPGPPPPRFRGPPPGVIRHPPAGYMPPRDFPPPPPPHFVPRPAAPFPPPIPFHQPPPIPLSEREFYREKRRLIGHITMKNDPMDDFARTLMERKNETQQKKKSPILKRSDSRSRSWSPRARRRSRSKSYSRSPIRSVVKTRSKTRSRTKSKTRSRSRTPKKKIRSRTRTRSRSLSRPRSRSRSHSRYWSRSPARLRSRSRERFRSRSRSFRPRSLSPRPRPRTRSRSRSSSFGPRSRKGPRPRNKSRSYTPKRRLSRSRSISRSPPRRHFSPYRSRSRSLSPLPAPQPSQPLPQLPPQPNYGRHDWDSQFRNYRGPLPAGPRFSPERYAPEYPPPYGVPQAPPPPPPPPLPPDEYYRMGPRAFEEYLRDYYSRYPHPANPPEYSRLPFPEHSRSRSPRRPRSWSPSVQMKQRDRIDGRNERVTSHRLDKPDQKLDNKPKEKRMKENKLPIKKVDKPSKQHVLNKVKSKTKKASTEKSSKSVKLEKEKHEKKPAKRVIAQKESKKSDSETNIKLAHRVEKRIKSPKNSAAKEKIDIKAEDKGIRMDSFQRIEEKPIKHQNKNINASVLVPIREADENESENIVTTETEVKEELKEDIIKLKEEIHEEAKMLETKKPKNKTVEKVKKVRSKHSKSKKLSGSESHTSDSASDIDNKKKRKLTQLIGISESSVTEDENISPTKRVKVESSITTVTSETEGDSEPPPPGTEEVSVPTAEPATTNQIAKKLSPDKSIKVKDQLMLDPPELSKWERDDADSDHSPEVSTTSSKTRAEKKSLPRSVIESAEKALVMKPLRSSAVSSTVASMKPQRKVYLDEEMTKKIERPKMIPRQTMMQITFSSAGSNKRKVSESDSKSDAEQKQSKSEKEQVATSKENPSVSRERRSVMERLGKQRSEPSSKNEVDKKNNNKDDRSQSKNERDERSHYRSDRDRDERSHYRSDRDRDERSHSRIDHDKVERSRIKNDPERDLRNQNKSLDRDDRSRNRNEHDRYERSKNRTDSDKELKFHKSYNDIDKSYIDLHRSHNKFEQSNVQSKSERTSDKSPDRLSHRNYDTGKSTRDKLAHQVEDKKFDKLDRKESVVDESKFEPDYEDSSGSESPEKISKAERLLQSSDSESASSDDDSPSKKKGDDEDEKKNKKNKHKKHKKHKHKHKKKKHKKHKEEKVKSSVIKS